MEAAQCPVHQAAPKVKQVKVVVDRQLCQGHAACMGEAPNIFHVDEHGNLHILKEVIDDDDMQAVQNAILYCPNSALSLKKE